MIFKYFFNYEEDQRKNPFSIFQQLTFNINFLAEMMMISLDYKNMGILVEGLQSFFLLFFVANLLFSIFEYDPIKDLKSIIFLGIQFLFFLYPTFLWLQVLVFIYLANQINLVYKDSFKNKNDFHVYFFQLFHLAMFITLQSGLRFDWVNNYRLCFKFNLLSLYKNILFTIVFVYAIYVTHIHKRKTNKLIP